MNLIESINAAQLRTDIPDFRPNGVGVERIFPVHTPRVEQIEVIRHGKVRRAKLYYLRALTGKKARIAERRR